ncbi:hypothetical protein, partial [Paraburkholderia acidipaludis]|uniref:hypothetical protein n=1 Tax=Paraburkholderia acidipaludis TaxID=660537 RepID=UPI001C3F1824
MRYSTGRYGEMGDAVWRGPGQRPIGVISRFSLLVVQNIEGEWHAFREVEDHGSSFAGEFGR